MVKHQRFKDKIEILTERRMGAGQARAKAEVVVTLTPNSPVLDHCHGMDSNTKVAC
jgi:hypothetical protein